MPSTDYAAVGAYCMSRSPAPELTCCTLPGATVDRYADGSDDQASGETAFSDAGLRVSVRCTHHLVKARVTVQVVRARSPTGKCARRPLLPVAD